MPKQSEARTDDGTPTGTAEARRAETPPSIDGDGIDPTDDRATTTGDPTPTFAYAPGAPVDGNPVLFAADGPADADVRRYEWAFGDGTTAPGEKASHVYDSAGEQSVTLTVVYGDGETETARRTVTVYREVAVEVESARDDPSLVAVDVSGTDEFDPTDAVAVESLRFGAPTALAMGCGATAVRSEARDGDLRVWFDAAATGLTDGDSQGRLAGRTTDEVPIAGTADATGVAGSASE